MDWRFGTQNKIFSCTKIIKCLIIKFLLLLCRKNIQKLHVDFSAKNVIFFLEKITELSRLFPLVHPLCSIFHWHKKSIEVAFKIFKSILKYSNNFYFIRIPNCWALIRYQCSSAFTQCYFQGNLINIYRKENTVKQEIFTDKPKS